MKRLAFLLGVGVFVVASAGDIVTQAMSALRSDPSMKVRAQAALVLGQQKAREASPALSDALLKDEAPAVRMAAANALGKMNEPASGPVLERAKASDPDPAVRDAASRALHALLTAAMRVPSPNAFSIEEPSGPGSALDKQVLRTAIARHLVERGFAVVPNGGMALRPALVSLRVDESGGRALIVVRVELLVEGGSRGAAVPLTGDSSLVAPERATKDALRSYSDKAIDQAARSLCSELALRLAGP